MAIQFHADHIAAARGAYEPQRLNHFTITIPDLGDAAEIIELSLRGFTPPTTDIQPFEIRYRNEARKVAGTVSVQDSNLTLNDYCDRDTIAALLSWCDQVYNPNDGPSKGEIGLARDYKRDCLITLHPPTERAPRTGGGPIPKRYFTAIGVWPTSRGQLGDLNMDASDQNTINVPLAVDKVVFGNRGVGGNR